MGTLVTGCLARRGSVDMSAARSYPRRNVKERRAAPPDEPRHLGPNHRDDGPEAPDGASGRWPDGVRERVDLTGLSIAGISRRQVGWVVAALVSVWIVIVFARQVSEATDATNRANQMATDNAALASEVESLQSEVALIVRPEYVSQQARAHGLGSPREIPFTLDSSGAPSPVDGAPGSASARLGAEADHQTPLESWLSLLFGPGQ